MSVRLAFLSLPLAVTVAAPAPASAEEPDVLIDPGLPHAEITRTDVAPTIDGVLDDAAWEAATVIEEFLQTEPDEGQPCSERTELRLLYDRNFLYLGVRCFDSEAEGIVATQMRRDASLAADDRISIVVDPYFSRRNGYYFDANPLGGHGDALIEANGDFNKSWDGIWECEASIDAEGWSLEIAIPFKTISFNPDTDRWGLNVLRFIRRKNEYARWASPSRDKSFNSFADAGVIEGIRDIDQGLGLDIKPYGIGTFRREHEKGQSDLDLDAGFDMFYKVTPSLTLATTFNTDFAETEVDDRQVNLTRFPLFFPEKRDFFLQDAGIFNFGGIRRNPLPFHSRRIGIGPGGEEKDILVGAKLTGRLDNLNLGLLDVQMKHDDELGDKNLFVGRGSINVFEQSTIGAIFTHGDPNSTSDAWTGGFDFNYRTSDLFDGKTLQAHAWQLGSDSSADGEHGGSAYGVKLSYPNDRIDWGVGYTRIDSDYDATLGFVPRRGIHEYFGDWRYRFRPDHDSIRSIDVGGDFYVVTDLEGNVETRNLEFNVFSLRTEPGDYIDLDISRQREVLTDTFEISDGVVLAPGSYKFDRYDLYFQTSQARPIDATFRIGGGEFFTGTREDYYLGLNWRPSSHFNLSAEYSVNDVHLDEGDFLTRIMRARATVQFTPDLSWSTYTQYDNVSESIGVNSKVHWIIQPGNEVYFVINQAVDREDDSYTFTETDITAKIGWTFRF
jgi:Domain of unknown function (DUF5916)/Carbohydrate family 9 binding domain-like